MINISSDEGGLYIIAATWDICHISRGGLHGRLVHHWHLRQVDVADITRTAITEKHLATRTCIKTTTMLHVQQVTSAQVRFNGLLLFCFIVIISGFTIIKNIHPLGDIDRQLVMKHGKSYRNENVTHVFPKTRNSSSTPHTLTQEEYTRSVSPHDTLDHRAIIHTKQATVETGYVTTTIIPYPLTQDEYTSNDAFVSPHDTLDHRAIKHTKQVQVEAVSADNKTELIPYPIEYFNRSTMLGPFELQPRSIMCSEEHTFLIYVISSAKEQENRTLMRETWLDLKRVTKHKYDGFHLEKMFVVGGLAYEASHVAMAVREESRIHGDILALDYLQDSYVNISRKVISSMFWIQDHCNLSRVDYVMKADMDTLVNIYYILALAWNEMNNGTAYDYICWYLQSKEVDRNGKYSEPWETYGQKDWPRYCHGPAYASHIGIYMMMLKNIPNIPIMKNEDVMMTALSVRNKIDIKVYSIPIYRIIQSNKGWKHVRGRKILIRIPHTMILAHELPGEEWRSAFGNMHSQHLMENLDFRQTIRRVRIYN